MKKIITDSAANIFANNINGIPHQSVSLALLCGQETFWDTPDFDKESFKQKIQMEKIPVKTACPSAESYLQAFGDADEVYVFTISAALSGSYNAAQVAKEMAQEKNPHQKIYVFDTRAAGPTERMAAYQASLLINEGQVFSDICVAIENYLAHAKVFFILKSLTNLANNGRVNKSIAKVAHALNINVLGWATPEGQIEQLTKSRGAKGARKKLLALLEQVNFDEQKLVIDHADNLAGAEALKELIQAKYPACHVEIGQCQALCRFYAEEGGLIIGCTVTQ
ncbi:DegV family protein [Ligilactobacillus saerimneri]|uniref:DegV family protein n=1 Tax=Ligilactobacillus saerimneri 30a TaxID=1227363 RepID=M5J5X6_9LACO|nr:DegV family protein [Ligilactobacillus saerimneri]EKW98815.1 DegV family protein [Ligilactobacillus saerimneri 30a]